MLRGFGFRVYEVSEGLMCLSECTLTLETVLLAWTGGATVNAVAFDITHCCCCDECEIEG